VDGLLIRRRENPQMGENILDIGDREKFFHQQTVG
jgi:hypothetical protein